MRVLWVENHAGFVQAAKRFLAAHDLTVTPTVAEALAALNTQAFDAVLTDFDLDDGKGTEVVAFAKQLPQRPAIIAVSSHADGNAALLAVGADAVCPKTQFADIAETIRRTVEKVRSSPSIG